MASDPSQIPGPCDAPTAVLWDMDGTLVDTEIHWFAAEAALMREHCLPWEEQDSLNMVGFALSETAAYMQSKGLELDQAAIGAQLHDRVLAAIHQDLPLRSGALELLLEMRKAGIPTALVTNSGSQLADAVISRLQALSNQAHTGYDDDLFDVVVTSDLGLPGKPDPAPYVFAARRLAKILGLETDVVAVAVEDSRTGIESAKRAGCVVVGVRHMSDLTAASPHVSVDSLAGVRLADVRNWCAAHAPGPGPATAESHP